MYLLSIPWITHFTLLEITHIALQCYYCNRSHFRQSWLIRLQENNNTFQEGWLWANQQLIIKNNKLLFQSTEFNFDSKMFHQTIFSYSNLCIWHPGDIFLWQRCYFCHLPAIFSLLLPGFAITCHCKSKIQLSFMFFTSITHCNRPLRKQVQKVTSLGCNWLILIHVVYFVLWQLY